MGRSYRVVWFWPENVKETLFIEAVSKLQRKWLKVSLYI